MARATAAASATALPAALETFVETERRRADVVGVAVAAFDQDGIRFAGGLGYADLKRRERVTVGTIFPAASISKLFTTALVFQEVEAGKISLDDSANQYLEPSHRIRNKQGASADVTIRHLLTHTSGLPVSWRGLEMGNPIISRLWNQGGVPRTLDKVVEGMRTVRAPGKTIIYSNGAFCLLAYLAARLNGRSFEELVRERVLEPLGMATSSFAVEPTGPGVATPYGRGMMGAGRRPAPTTRIWAGPAGALATSALELSRFGQMVLRGGEIDGQRVLSEATLNDALQLHAVNHPELDEGFGLGFMVSRYRGRTLAGHDGGFPGVSTRMAVLPDEGVGVTVLTNGGDPTFVHRVAERTFETLLDLEAEAIPGSPAGIPEDRAAEWSDFTKRVVGRYRLVDFTPPGVIRLAMGLMNRPRLSEVADGVVVLEGIGFEPAYLYPDGKLGHYRVAFPMTNGRQAVIEKRPNGTHIWVSLMHLFRPR